MIFSDDKQANAAIAFVIFWLAVPIIFAACIGWI